MATIAKTQQGILAVTLTEAEEDTYDGLAEGVLEAYVTQWLHDRRATVLASRLDALSAQDKAQVMQRLRPNKP